MRFRGFIPFEEKLHRKLGTFLEGKGFRASTQLIEEKKRALIYTRIDNSEDQLVFNALMWGNYDHEDQQLEFNWLRIHVFSSDNIMQIMPPSHSQTVDPYLVSGWIYTDEQLLIESLNEIDDLVRSHFEQWFPHID